MAKTGKSARAKGNQFEVKFCQLLVNKGFTAVTARSESKRLDDSGVDISTDCPFNFQLKAHEKGIGTHKLLKSMPNDKPPVLVHKRNHQGVVVSMYLEDFLKLLWQLTTLLKQ